MENKPEDLAEDLEVEERNKLMIFGRNVAEIPCFRSSFLYGGGAYFVGGLTTFLMTSRLQFSSHVGFGAFFCTTIVYWFNCRYNYSKTKFLHRQLQPAMRKQAVFEGTGIEAEAIKKAQEA